MVGFEWQSFSFLETAVINFRENIGCVKFFRKISDVLQNKQCFNFFWDDLILRIATSFFLFVGVFAFIFVFYFVFGELLPNLWNLSSQNFILIKYFNLPKSIIFITVIIVIIVITHLF